MSELTSMAASTLVGLTVAAVFILAVMIGLTLWLDRSKLRARRGRMAARSLDDILTGERAEYLPPDAPRGPVDQLKPGTTASSAS